MFIMSVRIKKFVEVIETFGKTRHIKTTTRLLCVACNALIRDKCAMGFFWWGGTLPQIIIWKTKKWVDEFLPKTRFYLRNSIVLFLNL